VIGFLLRKTFYDLWDNLFKIAALNLGFIACIAIPVFLPGLSARFTDSFVLDIIFSAIGILICSIYLAAAAFAIKPISDYESFSFRDFFRSFKIAWPAGLVTGFFVFLLFLIVTVILPFYLSMEPPLLGLALAAIIFWTAFFALLSFQFYFSVTARLGPGLIKSLKKCVLIAMDNTGMSFFLIIHNFFALLLSAFLAFMFPGPAGVLLYIDQAVRLRMLKYDWLEANPDADRRKIPWDELLIEDREKTGTRTFRNFTRTSNLKSLINLKNLRIKKE
jgi:hypothetical protein